MNIDIEMFYLKTTFNFGIPPVLVFKLEVYYLVHRLLTGLTAKQKGTTARWYSNKLSLHSIDTNKNTKIDSQIVLRQQYLAT